MSKRLTNAEFNQKVDLLKKMDTNNNGATHYLKSFLSEQDLLAAKAEQRKKATHKTHISREERELKQILKHKPVKKEIVKCKQPNIIKSILLFPYTVVYEFFEWYIEGMTWVKGLVLTAFAFTTIFCGWIAFLKTMELICDSISLYTPLNVSSPFENADYFPWITLLVVWLLPFLIHFLGKYVIVFIPVLVIFLVIFQLVIGDDFLTKAFLLMLDSFIKKM